MIINIANVPTGAVTNLFKTSYFQGDVVAPMEVVSAYLGIYGEGDYLRFLEELLVDKTAWESYNAH